MALRLCFKAMEELQEIAVRSYTPLVFDQYADSEQCIEYMDTISQDPRLKKILVHYISEAAFQDTSDAIKIKPHTQVSVILTS